MLSGFLAASAAWSASPLQQLDRRAVLRTCVAATGAALMPWDAANAISATTMSGKSKPDLGLFLVNAPQPSGKSGISGELVLANGQVATVGFSTPWKVAEGSYYDIEMKSNDGSESAFVQLLPAGSKKIDKAIATEVFNTEGRYGAYGAPTDVKVKEGAPTASGARTFDVSFTTLSPSMAEVSRKGVVAAINPKGSSESLLLVASTSVKGWKSGGEAEVRRAAESFQILDVRPSQLKQEPSSDYRYGKTSGPSSMKSRNDGF